jgi:hypothetical protein
MSEQIMRQNLLVIAQTFATAKGWALATVSKQIHGNQAFLERYLAGEISTTIKTYFVMVDRLREAWPPGTKWPATLDVPRPKRVEYRRPANPTPRGAGGRFLGKKVDEKVRSA